MKNKVIFKKDKNGVAGSMNILLLNDVNINNLMVINLNNNKKILGIDDYIILEDSLCKLFEYSDITIKSISESSITLEQFNKTYILDVFIKNNINYICIDFRTIRIAPDDKVYEINSLLQNKISIILNNLSTEFGEDCKFNIETSNDNKTLHLSYEYNTEEHAKLIKDRFDKYIQIYEIEKIMK